jgi:ribosomal protein S18 acetylase RimI-like enzyme
VTSPAAVIRPMTTADLGAVGSVTNTAFGTLRGDPDSVRFPSLLFETRLAADPAGCFVAASHDDPGQLTGALFSVARGGLGWFGPLAVSPGAQRSGIGRELTAACVESWQARGVRLMGLETFADSPLHVHMYSKLGFRPAWTGVSFSRPLGLTAMPAGVQVDETPDGAAGGGIPGNARAGQTPGGPRSGGRLPGLSYLYPGLDVSGEASATLSCAAGVVLTTGDGVALCHLKPTFQAPQTGYLPFLAAQSRESFERLLAAAEHLSREAGCTSLFTRTPGSSWATMDALVGRGYRAGGAMLRMKRGEDLDYDRTGTYYCDNWL